MSADPSSHAHSKSPDGTCASRVPQGPEGRPPNIAQPGRAGISIQRIERRRRGTDLFIATEAFPESGIISALQDITLRKPSTGFQQPVGIKNEFLRSA